MDESFLSTIEQSSIYSTDLEGLICHVSSLCEYLDLLLRSHYCFCHLFFLAEHCQGQGFWFLLIFSLNQFLVSWFVFFFVSLCSYYLQYIFIFIIFLILCFFSLFPFNHSVSKSHKICFNKCTLQDTVNSLTVLYVLAHQKFIQGFGDTATPFPREVVPFIPPTPCPQHMRVSIVPHPHQFLVLPAWLFCCVYISLQLFVYFWLCWVCVAVQAVLSLRYVDFSLQGVSCCRARLPWLQRVGSVVVALALEHRLSSCGA